MRFEGTESYVADSDLKIAVNAAIALERPLLIKGEPGTGKTVLAAEIAQAIGAPLIEWHIKSTTKAIHGLYEYAAVARLRDSQLGDPRVSDISNYIRRGKLWEGFAAPERPVLLIDEIDKADIEFPNDLLQELDRMEFHVYETGETINAKQRPVVLITSNNEKELPDAFLRRCFFHYIRFPDPETQRTAVNRIRRNFTFGNFSSARHDVPLCLLRALRAVLRTALHAAGHAHRIQGAPDDVITHAREVLHTAAANEHQRVLLQVVPHPRNVGGDFNSIGQAHTGHFAQRRIRLLRSLCEHAYADAPLLRAALQRGALGFPEHLLSTLANQLANRRHS
jgi:hypothetical protein